MSSQLVPALSDISAKGAPISQVFKKPDGKTTVSTLSNNSGSLFFTHKSLGAVNPGKTIFPDNSRTCFWLSKRSASM